MSLFVEKNSLDYVIPGGLVAVGTNIDPTLTKGDRLVGQVIGDVGHLPDVYVDLEIEFFLVRKLIGVAHNTSEEPADKKKEKVPKITVDENLMLSIGSTSCQAKVKGRRH